MLSTINDTINKRKQKKSKFATNKLTQEKTFTKRLLHFLICLMPNVFVINIITYNVIEKIY